MKILRRTFIGSSLASLWGWLGLGSVSIAKGKVMSEKQIKIAYQVKDKHWVGDGFHVHGLLRPTPELTSSISPFILMDYGSPAHFDRTTKKRGVGAHPHRGFETVTLAYQGEVEHRDSAGGGGIIKEGDVQWMTAGKGIVHDEFHSREFAAKGGTFEMVQLWVNLPKQHKMTDPKYQALEAKDFPQIDLSPSLKMRVIAGKHEKSKGKASTFTPMNIFDFSSTGKGNAKLNLPTETNTILLVMSGTIRIGDKSYGEQEILIFEREGEEIAFDYSEGFKGLLLNGTPINEPVVAQGPFVMNTQEEIRQAIEDYRAGKMGSIAPEKT